MTSTNLARWIGFCVRGMSVNDCRSALAYCDGALGHDAHAAALRDAVRARLASFEAIRNVLTRVSMAWDARSSGDGRDAAAALQHRADSIARMDGYGVSVCIDEAAHHAIEASRLTWGERSDEHARDIQRIAGSMA